MKENPIYMIEGTVDANNKFVVWIVLLDATPTYIKRITK